MICPICHKDTLITVPISKVSNTGGQWIMDYCTNQLCNYYDPKLVSRGENTFLDERKLEEVDLK